MLIRHTDPLLSFFKPGQCFSLKNFVSTVLITNHQAITTTAPPLLFLLPTIDQITISDLKTAAHLPTVEPPTPLTFVMVLHPTPIVISRIAPLEKHRCHYRTPTYTHGMLTVSLPAIMGSFMPSVYLPATAPPRSFPWRPWKSSNKPQLNTPSSRLPLRHDRPTTIPPPW